MDICVYVHVNKIIRCEYNNGGGGARLKLDKLGGGACPKSLKTPALYFLFCCPILPFLFICIFYLKLLSVTFGALAINKQNGVRLAEEHCSRSYVSLFMSMTNHADAGLLRSSFTSTSLK